VFEGGDEEDDEEVDEEDDEEEMGKKEDGNNKLKCTCKNMLKLQMKDSLKILNGSLSKLTETLKNQCRNISNCNDCLSNIKLCLNCQNLYDPKTIFKYTYRTLQGDYLNPDELFPLFMGKLHYPYSKISNYDILQTKICPPRNWFENILDDSLISIQDYKHFQNFWQKCKFETIGQLTLAYVKNDVDLLASILVFSQKSFFEQDR
jgi:hypothetical protein